MPRTCSIENFAVSAISITAMTPASTGSLTTTSAASGTEPAMLLYTVTQTYDPANPDEHRLSYNDPTISFDWSTQMR